jgi:hypothetical protein
MNKFVAIGFGWFSLRHHLICANKYLLVWGILALCLFVYGTVLFFSPLPIQIIDRDSSGIVSIDEALDAIDIGKRAVSNKLNCIEYFWLKDGFPAYESCANINYTK